MNPEFLTLPDRRLAYQRFRGRPDKAGIIFLGGFASDMTGTKASFLAERCSAANLSFMRFDYRGHGQSEGDFKKGTIGLWLEDACTILDQVTEGPQIVIGSSMGGWLALLLARQKPERIKALIGIAAAPDFTEDLVWAKLSDTQRAQLEKEGEIDDGGAPLTKGLIEEARAHLLLRAPLPLSCPVHLLQGMKDEEVPWGHALRIVQAIPHEDVRITLIKHGDHRLSQPKDLELLWQTVEEFIN